MASARSHCPSRSLSDQLLDSFNVDLVDRLSVVRILALDNHGNDRPIHDRLVARFNSRRLHIDGAPEITYSRQAMFSRIRMVD